jgi:arginase
MTQKSSIQIISAPSILGLKPTGVDKLGATLLANNLDLLLHSHLPVIHTPTLNQYYSVERDPQNGCINAPAIREFSLNLNTQIIATLHAGHFPLVLGGDCSILLGITPALKARATYGLIFCDAHADFYEPEKSITGEVADMDLAIVTGRGPVMLTNINNQHPYLNDENVIHIGQRDGEETRKYKSQDIRETAIRCIDYEEIKKIGIHETIQRTIEYMNEIHVDGFWIHFDADVLSDEENPAVDYRIPGGLQFDEYEIFLTTLIGTNKIIGMSVSIFNPNLDNEQGSIAMRLTELLSNSFNQGL